MLSQDKTLLLFLLGLLLFASPLLEWWTRPGAPWYLPYLLWGLIIALAALAQWYRGPHDL
ncbi:hypothetical protein SAMN05421693_13027 [Ectothiorhodospira magna]|uniref:Uncharacterized protein n=1 Tax=Ectothiorhodospira magna TaxID=867345 RepID=A0A1H9FWT1_9GAMM|nr:hypothetical protein [Ectothiorhodospira magna]SEQ42324.1 hypothetical protein SAMN05421693_13027 [Ectothiorhodospira magna]